jgi:hypothetical protein
MLYVDEYSIWQNAAVPYLRILSYIYLQQTLEHQRSSRARATTTRST